ncbi:MAG: glycosyltransferase family 39 protein [Candidatus Hinthialibacter antarcticus]|nr:glycosyltransferase family 39 protein [Candidatus Hinthialibacter antarcticus]
MMNNRNFFGAEKLPYVIVVSIFCFLIIARLYLIIDLPLFHPSEGRYAEVSRNMVSENDWVTPQIEVGTPFWGKPPLLFWLNAMSISVFGATIFSTRLPSFLLCVLAVLLTFKLGELLKGRLFGVYCSIVLSTTALFFMMSGAVLTDIPLVFSITFSLVSFAFAMQSQAKGLRNVWAYCFFAGIGLSVLSKGLIGIVFIILPVFVGVVLSSEWRNAIKRFPLVTGFLLTSLIAVPWHVMAEFRTPGFLDYYFVGEHFKRFFVAGWEGDLYGSGHKRARGTILVYALIDTMPWSILFIAALAWLRMKGMKFFQVFNDIWSWYLLAWFITPLVFFCFARNIVFTYALPSLPPFAILAVWVFHLVLRKNGMDAQPFRLRNSSENGVLFLSNQVLVLAVLIVPVLCLSLGVFSNALLQKHAEQQKIISKFQDLSENQEQPELYYIGKNGYTMSFYTHGQINMVHSPESEVISTALNDIDRDYFILSKSMKRKASIDFLNQTDELFDDYKLVLRSDLPLGMAVAKSNEDIQHRQSRYFMLSSTCPTVGCYNLKTLSASSSKPVYQ